MFGAKAAKLGIELLYELADEVPHQLLGDALRLRQVLINLVGNAVKFTHQGEVCVLVQRRGVAEPGLVGIQFEVRDTGIGMAAHQMDRLFKAFSQVDASTTRQYGGTGLGLVIAQKLVQLMGGTIQAVSQSGQGSTFSFTIQLAPDASSTGNRTRYDMAALAGKRILIVDDKVTNRAILQRQLAHWQLQPLLASSPQQALAMLAGGIAVDLIVIDRQMPGLDGLQLAGQLHEWFPAIPRLLLSSPGDEVGGAQRSLFVAVVAKPIRQHVLARHLQQALQPSSPAPLQFILPAQLTPDFSVRYPLAILVAEDNVMNQRLIGHVLRKLGYQPDIVDNGQQALAALAQKAYGLVLMDMQMPVLDGLAATRQIRQRTGYQPVIIALTANALVEHHQQCLAAGMDDFITKPIRLPELTTKLAHWYPRLATN